MAERRPLPFAPGDRATLLCVGHELDVLYARIPETVERPSPEHPLSARDASALPRGRSLIVRTGISRVLPIAGEWFEATIERAWRFGGSDHLKADVERVWLDLDAVGLPVLPLRHQHAWTLDGWLERHGLELDDLEPAYDEVTATPERREVEMAQVLPDPFTPLELEEDPILEAVAWREAGDARRCEKLLSEMLRRDLRCVDAHAHLGNLAMTGYLGRRGHDRAQRHYRVGVEIAERALAPDGQDVTPKGFIDNRPYLRALHGLGLARWALGAAEEAERLFAKLLWRDPADGAGARFLIQAVRDGIDYEAFDA